MSEEPDLREYVAERIHNEWCQHNSADVVWRGAEMEPAGVDIFLAMADAAIAAIEYDYTLLISAGLLVAVYSDCVVDYRVPVEDEV